METWQQAWDRLAHLVASGAPGVRLVGTVRDLEAALGTDTAEELAPTGAVVWVRRFGRAHRRVARLASRSPDEAAWALRLAQRAEARLDAGAPTAPLHPTDERPAGVLPGGDPAGAVSGSGPAGRGRSAGPRR